MALPLIKRSMEPIITKPPNEHYWGWQKFMCPPTSSQIPKFPIGNPRGTIPTTPDLVPATLPTNPTVVDRQLLVGLDLTIPPGHLSNLTTVNMWVINILNNAITFPSALVRVAQGEVVQCFVKAAGNTHTIHWHGIEPTCMNDGVGKHSFEGSGNFVYQYQTNEAGTYFYHCHESNAEPRRYGLQHLNALSDDLRAGAVTRNNCYVICFHLFFSCIFLISHFYLSTSVSSMI